MKKIFDKWKMIENSEFPILIEEEMGIEKDLIAATIHFNNTVRKNMPFVMQNCSELSDKYLMVELFGHEKGSFESTVCDKKGLFEIADGGTLFLDEVEDLGTDIQGKLLRVIENGVFCRVGGSEEKKVDVRLIAATNKNLSEMVEEGLFLKDLFCRFNIF